MSKIIKKIAVVFAIVYILFISIFAFDAFEGEVSFLMKMAGFLIHLIPSFLLVALLLTAIRFKLAGGILHIAAAAAFTLFFNTYDSIYSFSLITIPLLMTGILFIVSHFTGRKKTETSVKIL